MIHLVEAPVVENVRVGADCFRMAIASSELAQRVKPGQFFQIRCSEQWDPLLRRPISLHRVEREQGLIYLLFKTKGRGTQLLSMIKEGEKLDVMGPLGNGFYLPDGEDRLILIGGGIGVAPLLAVAEEGKRRGIKIMMILGANHKEELYCLNDFSALGTVIVTTVDGSYGYRGYATDVLEAHLRTHRATVMACGPEGMLRKVAEISHSAGVKCQVSLEGKMACGIGACLVCACKTKGEAGEETVYRRVCTCGPVFRAEEVIWNEEA